MLFLAAAAAALTACGANVSTPPPAVGEAALEQTWIENAQRFIATVQADLDLTSAGGGNLVTARKALGDASDLYTILVAYTNFDGCSHALANVGTPSRKVVHVVRTLSSACRRLERASALFHVAVTRNRPRALLAATRMAIATEPLLFRARAQLSALAGQRTERG
jgi:hypothetical protein